MKILIQPKFLEHGYLSSMLRSLLNSAKLEKKLDNNVLTHIATILANEAKSGDIYEKLFNTDDYLISWEGRTLHSKDLASFVLMDNNFARGYFARSPGRTAMSDTTNCGGVPLLLEGSKRLYNRTYSSWLDEWDDNKKLDIFLPAQLASYTLTNLGEYEQAEKYGLLVYHKFNVQIRDEIIVELRNRVGHWNQPNAKMVKAVEDDTEEMKEVIEIYNKSSYRMRNMVLRGWCWNEICRSSSMICDWNNWDEMPPKISDLAGLQPKAAGGQSGAEKFLGIKL